MEYTMEWQLNQIVSEAAFEDAWTFLKTVVPEGELYRTPNDTMRLLGIVVMAWANDPAKLMSALSLALEAAYRLGEQA